MSPEVVFGEYRFETAKKLDQSEIEQLHSLWNREYPIEVEHKQLSDTEQYLAKHANPFHYKLKNSSGALMAWLTTFDRDDKRFFVLIVDRSCQGRGFGSFLLEKARMDNDELVGWIVIEGGYFRKDGSVYPATEVFYRKNGFEVLKDVRSETNILNTVLVKWKM